MPELVKPYVIKAAGFAIYVLNTETDLWELKTNMPVLALGEKVLIAVFVAKEGEDPSVFDPDATIKGSGGITITKNVMVTIGINLLTAPASLSGSAVSEVGYANAYSFTVSGNVSFTIG